MSGRGDAARIDGDGFVWIIDRLRDGFTTEGGVVYPGDVERVLLEHPGVDDVGVVGVPRTGVSGSGHGRAQGPTAMPEARPDFRRPTLAVRDVINV